MDEMVEKALKRPKNYFKLSPREQWKIDSELGILDWDGPDNDKDRALLYNYFSLKKKG